MDGHLRRFGTRFPFLLTRDMIELAIPSISDKNSEIATEILGQPQVPTDSCYIRIVAHIRNTSTVQKGAKFAKDLSELSRSPYFSLPKEGELKRVSKSTKELLYMN